jgi:hypothetical protein
MKTGSGGVGTGWLSGETGAGDSVRGAAGVGVALGMLGQ